MKNSVMELEVAVQEFYRQMQHIPERWYIVAGITGVARPHPLLSVHQDFTSAMGAYGQQEPGQCGVLRKAENYRLELVI